MYACMAAMHACVHYLLHGLNKLPAGTRSTHVCTCDLVDELEEVLRWHRPHCKRPQRHEFRLPAVDREHLPKLCPG